MVEFQKGLERRERRFAMSIQGFRMTFVAEVNAACASSSVVAEESSVITTGICIS